MEELEETYAFLEKLIVALKGGTPFDAKIGQAANHFNLHLRSVQASSLGSRETVRGMRELDGDKDTIIELQSAATSLLGILGPNLYPTSAFVPHPHPEDSAR